MRVSIKECHPNRAGRNISCAPTVIGKGVYLDVRRDSLLACFSTTMAPLIMTKSLPPCGAEGPSSTPYSHHLQEKVHSCTLIGYSTRSFHSVNICENPRYSNTKTVPNQQSPNWPKVKHNRQLCITFGVVPQSTKAYARTRTHGRARTHISVSGFLVGPIFQQELHHIDARIGRRDVHTGVSLQVGRFYVFASIESDLQPVDVSLRAGLHEVQPLPRVYARITSTPGDGCNITNGDGYETELPGSKRPTGKATVVCEKS